MMRCPFFEEVLVAYCRAFPIKKLVPSDRLHADCVCTHEGYDDCPVFREVLARTHAANTTGSAAHGNAADDAKASSS